MSEPIQFYANVESVQGGDDEVRIVLSVKDTPVDLAAAVGMLGKLNRVLKVDAYLGSDTLASFAAAIPQMKTGIQFRKDKSPVIKLDIPASDALSALRLVGYSERVIRFEVADDGERARKEKKERQPREPKGAYSYFWEYLHPNGGKGGSGFATLPGVREEIEKLRLMGTESTWELLHQLFGVETLSGTGPQEVLAKFPNNQRVELFIDRAMRFQNEKETRCESR